MKDKFHESPSSAKSSGSSSAPKTGGKRRRRYYSHGSGVGSREQHELVRSLPQPAFIPVPKRLDEVKPPAESVDLKATFEIAIQLPSYAKRSKSNKRTALAHCPQLVILLIDDSESMFYDGKCGAATKAVTDMLCEMKLRTDGELSFRVAIIPFGDFVGVRPDWLGVLVKDVKEDEIKFLGKHGKTDFGESFMYIERLCQAYEQFYLSRYPAPLLHPAPLIVFMSDGRDTGEVAPVAIANRIKSMPLSIGVPPLILTVGIEFGGDTPDENLLKRLASVDEESGRSLYFHISNANMLAQFLAKSCSTGSSSAAEILREAGKVNPDWK